MEAIKGEKDDPMKFQGELTFGFFGAWQVEVEFQRTESANESKILDLFVKPRLSNIQAQIVEYEFPEDTAPLFPLYDGKNSIWVGDSASPRLWQFSLDTQEFSSYSFDGISASLLTQDNKGQIWFIDPLRNQFGFIDPENNLITTKTIPNLDPVIRDNIPVAIQADFDGNIWITINNKDRILKYLPELDEFEEIRLPEIESLPFALTMDKDGNIWFSTTGTGKIGFIDPKTNKITQISMTCHSVPEALIFDEDGNLWITEHLGLAITKFNPVLGTFERITVPDETALPFGMVFDKYGNIWFAQHTVDKIAVFDPDNNDLIEDPDSN